jgi:hypothetical protein
MESEKELPVLLSIDPSVRNLGWCCVNMNRLWDEDDWYDLEDGRGWTYGLVQMESTKGVRPDILKYRWMEAYLDLKTNLDIDDNEPTHFASEWPAFYNSEKGRIAASNNYTVGLASISSYIAGQFNFVPQNIALWTPMQWKFNAPKDVTKNRFVQRFGERGEKLARQVSDDVIDAIMIAVYWLSIYRKRQFRWQKGGEYYAVKK